MRRSASRSGEGSEPGPVTDPVHAVPAGRDEGPDLSTVPPSGGARFLAHGVILLVLVCAAVSCPILEAKPFAGTDLDARMERAARRYLASGFGAQVRDGTLFISKIFDWYADDFGGAEGAASFARARLPDKKRAALPERPPVQFLDYNWTLNQR